MDPSVKEILLWELARPLELGWQLFDFSALMWNTPSYVWKKKKKKNPRHYHPKWWECLVICIIFLSVVWGYPAISLFAVQQVDFCCIPCLKLLIMFNIFNRKTPWNKKYIYSNSSIKQNIICISAIKQKTNFLSWYTPWIQLSDPHGASFFRNHSDSTEDERYLYLIFENRLYCILIINWVGKLILDWSR